MASGNTKFKIEHGLDVVGTANVSGSLRIGGDFTVDGNLAFSGTSSADYKPTSDNTYALGNTTARWLLYSSTATIGNVTVSDTSTLNNVIAGNLLPISNTTSIFGSATKLWTITANTITAISSVTTGNVVVTNTAAAATFNALSGVASATEYITTTAAHGLTTGDYVQYLVAAGNTAVSGLSNAAYYYVVGANTTALQLSATYGGSAINITAGSSETGHTLTPIKITLSQNGSIFAPTGVANVGTLRVLGSGIVNGSMTVVSDFAVTTGNVAIKTSLLFVDATNNRIGLNNSAPSADGLVTIAGNVFFNTANNGVRFQTSNTAQNSSIAFMSSAAGNTRLTFSTYDNSNSSVSDGGFLFNLVNSTTVTAGLLINSNNFQYKSGNVVHAGNFGIYNSSGTRVGP
jgi:hypothetical protein